MTNEILEPFLPTLCGESLERYKKLITNIKKAYPNYRNELVRRELESYICDNNDLEQLKYKAVLSALYDLSQQGWSLIVNDEALNLKITEATTVDKDYIRNRLDSERRAQFQSESVKRFITRMERLHCHNGYEVSIKSLIGDSEYLLDRIKQGGERIVQPYIQLVKHEIDEHTGYLDSDIWRYFRYTWSIPYKSMPGRNLFYLVRDSAQQFHPIIGIFALGNSVLNLTVRDDEIGWSVEAIQRKMKRESKDEISDNLVSGTNGTVKIKKKTYLEDEIQYQQRLQNYSRKTILQLIENLKNAIADIYVCDLGYKKGTKYPKPEKISELKVLSETLRDKVINNKKTVRVTNWRDETKTPLFHKKRVAELARLLEAQRTFNEAKKNDYVEWLEELLKNENGRKAVNVALVANRKTKIGSNIMEIIVCGAIPPYNELLGCKLISILACSPQVIRDCTQKYKNQVSEIASRMKGARVIRDSRLVFLGTTSLYALGSSQYNRIKVPMTDNFTLHFKKMGITEGYGTVYFSKMTTTTMMRILEIQDGGRKINNIFGEGTSPRFRLISRGLKAIGIRADTFLRHYSPRIVYSVELALNTNEFLLGHTNDITYPFDIESNESVLAATQGLINYWERRWFQMRLNSVNIEERLLNFKPENILVSIKR